MQKFSGNIVDVVSKEIFKGSIIIENGKIKEVKREEVDSDQYILPGLIDAHIHVESSMLTPVEFARLASPHGTVATVSDPHEIANVLGIDGVNYMIENGKKTAFKFYFGAPSCVPATGFESSGAQLSAKETEELLKSDDIWYLAEMMNFPGVLFNDKEVHAKLDLAKKYNKPVDGHAPGVIGSDAEKYINAGISTDHECFTMEEALEKISYGMKVLIREGSAAKNYETLSDLLSTHPDDIMLCSDDKHPDDLMEGHINLVIKRSLAKGYDLMNTLRACTLNPVKHYKLDCGLLQNGDAADFIIVDNLQEFNILSTYADGELIAQNGKTRIESIVEKAPNRFKASEITLEDVFVKAESENIQVIEALEGELITQKLKSKAKVINGNVVSDVDNDVLKMLVLNRYEAGAKPSIGFIKGIGLKTGAMASTVAHDSHNIIAVGANDEELIKAVNLVIKSKGGISCCGNSKEKSLALPVGGIMTNANGIDAANAYEKLDKMVKELGSPLKAPYMTLSFMALLVIPELKLSDKGLFDGGKFEFTNLFV